jgi:hypothetical protein
MIRGQMGVGQVGLVGRTRVLTYPAYLTYLTAET